MLNLKITGADAFVRNINRLGGSREVVYNCLKEVANYERDVAIQITPIDHYAPYPYPQYRKHDPGYMKEHWKEPKLSPTGTGYEAVIENEAYYGVAVEGGHKAYPGQFIPPLGVEQVTDYIKGIHIIPQIEQVMETQASAIYERKYGMEIERIFRDKND